MNVGTSLYRAVLRLYPRDFRCHYGDDLVQHFTDLVERDGAVAAWRRTLVDLTVTVPHYRLETVMSRSRSTAALVVVSAAFALGAVAIFAVGWYAAAALLFLLAVGIAIAERTPLARSLRVDGNADRRRQWARSGASALVAVAVVVIGLIDLGGKEHWPTGRLMVYNLVFFAAVVTAFAFLLAGWRRPRAS